MLLTIGVLLAVSTTATLGIPLAGSPTVRLDNAIVTGLGAGSVSKFLGIPFAQPPKGDRRFRLPVAVPPYEGTLSATKYGPACPQQTPSADSGSPTVDVAGSPLSPDQIDGALKISRLQATDALESDEDCLSINVIKPAANISTQVLLPVLVWIYGGAFEFGDTVSYDDTGVRLVKRSLELGQPLIYVSMNYRVSAWGFLPGAEVKKAGLGNLGLHDQREALLWVQKYIGAFGGDKTKVTLWGQSAGAISVSLHMLTNGGITNGLFRGGFMQSGAPIPIGDISDGQKYYDALVADTGCSKTIDTLECLRGVSSDALQAAVDKSPNVLSYQSLSLAWVPRADGVFLADNPLKLVQEGKVADIPFVTGNVDDEGTAFAFSSLNVTNDAQFREYIKTNFLPKAPDSELAPLWSAYPDVPRAGSPFGTGLLWDIGQYKRIAAFQGDSVFQAPRRFFLQQRSGKQKTWSYLSKRSKYFPLALVGSSHGSDLKIDLLDDNIVRFTSTLNPNNGTGVVWPQYTPASPQLLTFPTTIFGSPSITLDNYRADGLKLLAQLGLKYPDRKSVV